MSETKKVTDWMPEPTSRYSAYGQMKVVCAHDLEKSYDDGWRLVEVIGFQEVGTQYEPCYQCNSQSNTAERGLVYNRPQFLVGKPYGETLGEVQRKLIEQVEVVKTLSDELRELRHDHKTIGEDLKALDERNQKQYEELKQAREKRRVMEVDLGKLRRHFGAKAFEEALGAE